MKQLESCQEIWTEEKEEEEEEEEEENHKANDENQTQSLVSSS